MRNDFLDVVGSYYNFRRFKAPQRLFNNWVTYHLDSGVRLTIVDCAFGERPHELQIDDTRLKHVRLLHVRAQAHSELWIRDALINWGVAHLPNDSKYVCWDDTDVKHVRPDWAAETVHMLQHCRVGQTWSTSIDLGPDGQIVPNDWGEEERLIGGQEFVTATPRVSSFAIPCCNLDLWKSTLALATSTFFCRTASCL